MKLAASLLAVAAGVAAAACGDELSLDVEVRHPAAAAVATTVVSIYESSSTTCKQIELGDLSTAELTPILVAERTGPGPLDGISREGRKLVVARGFDAAGRYLTAGCAEQETITGRAIVPVDTAFTATLSISAIDPDVPGIPLTLTDAEGRSLAGHPVTWRVYGPDGAAPAATAAALAPAEDGAWELAAPTCTGDAGVARVHPVPPSKVGGYAIAIRPSWPSQPNTLLTSFTRVDPMPESITPKLLTPRPCTLRVAGPVRRLVCVQLLAGSPFAREYDVTVEDGRTALVVRDTATIDAGVVALFSVERAAAVRDVYAVTADARVLGLFGPSVAPAPGAHLPAGTTASDAALVPACDGGGAAQLVLNVTTPADRRLVAMPPMGGPTSDYHGVSTDSMLQLGLRGTGCVTELAPGGGEPRRRPAAIVDVAPRVGPNGRAATFVVFECDLADRTRCRTLLPVPETGAGLAPPPPAGALGAPVEEPRLTGMSFDASGVVMSSWVLLPTGGAFALVERERVPSAAIPRSVVYGRFDGDGVTDLFWDLQNANLSTSNLQVTYGRTIGAARLSALSGAEAIVADAVLAGDLTGDGFDDVVLVGRQRRTDGMAFYGITVIAMGVPVGNPDTAVDRPCP